jgi:hypothetical protein
VNDKGGEIIGNMEEAKMYQGIAAAGNIMKLGSKASECDCVCRGTMDT